MDHNTFYISNDQILLSFSERLCHATWAIFGRLIIRFFVGFVSPQSYIYLVYSKVFHFNYPLDTIRLIIVKHQNSVFGYNIFFRLFLSKENECFQSLRGGFLEFYQTPDTLQGLATKNYLQRVMVIFIEFLIFITFFNDFHNVKVLVSRTFYEISGHY